MNGPRFDRIIPLITLILVGLGVVFLLELNRDQLIFNVGAGLPTFSIAWGLIGVLAMVTGIGVELVARGYPQIYTSGWHSSIALGGRRIELALPLWSLPMLTPIAIFAFFRLFRGVLQYNAYLLVLVATFGLLLLVLSAQHYLIAGSPTLRRFARSALAVIAYALAFAIFSAVTFNRYRTLYAVALVFPSSLLLAADLLRGRVAALWPTAGVIALALVQCYWTLNYWPVPYLFVSAALLVIFYVLIGLAQTTSGQALQQADRSTAGLTRRAIAEYGAVGMIALLAIVTAMAIWPEWSNAFQLP